MAALIAPSSRSITAGGRTSRTSVFASNQRLPGARTTERLRSFKEKSTSGSPARNPENPLDPCGAVMGNCCPDAGPDSPWIAARRIARLIQDRRVPPAARAYPPRAASLDNSRTRGRNTRMSLSDERSLASRCCDAKVHLVPARDFSSGRGRLMTRPSAGIRGTRRFPPDLPSPRRSDEVSGGLPCAGCAWRPLNRRDPRDGWSRL